MLKSLYDRIPGQNNSKKQKSSPPTLLVLMQKCQKYNIPYGLMCDLKFNDLKALIVEYEIIDIKEQFRRLQQQNRANRGVEIAPANNSQMLTMFGRNKKKEVS